MSQPSIVLNYVQPTHKAMAEDEEKVLHIPCLSSGVFSCTLMLQGKVLESLAAIKVCMGQMCFSSTLRPLIKKNLLPLAIHRWEVYNLFSYSKITP